MESQIGSTESLTTFPAEYWEAEGSVHGALVENVGTNNLVILSSRDIPIGSKLNLRIFYANEYEFDCIKLAANTNWKRLHIEEDWKGYKYGLDFVQISEEEHQELKNLLDGHSPSEEPLERQDVVPIESLPEKSSSPPLPNSDLSTSSTANCKFYKNGKCLRTSTFCDLCNDEDGFDLGQKPSTIPRTGTRCFSLFRAGLSKLAEEFHFISRNC